MKEMICSFLFALVLSCLLNSVYESGPPFPWPVGVNQVKEAPLGMKREEGNIGEMQYVDGARPVTIMTAVDEQGGERNVDMPLGANN
jgi:hypothetical protein